MYAEHNDVWRSRIRVQQNIVILYIKIKMHSSCEIEDFVEAHLRKLRVILPSRVLLGVCPHEDAGRRLPLELQLVPGSTG